jgi:hypothetical protein
MPSRRINVGRARRATPLPSPKPRREAFAHRQRRLAIAFCGSAGARVLHRREEIRKKFSEPELLGDLLDSASEPPPISRSATRIAHADMSIAVLAHADA